MRTPSRSTMFVGGMATAAYVGWTLRDGGHARHVARQMSRRARRQVRDVVGRLQGDLYAIDGRIPDPNITDAVLADRVRSQLGPLEKALDLPRVHVMVHDHTALLHGVVPTAEARNRVEQKVLAVSGVSCVESHLHIGFGAGDEQPSTGRRVHHAARSHTLVTLLDAATGAGVAEHLGLHVVRAVLSTFAERLSRGERRHVAAHLPDDVKALFVPPLRIRPVKPARHVVDFVDSVVDRTGDQLDEASATEVVGAILRTLRDLVPEEAMDVAAALPHELRLMWEQHPLDT